MLGELIVEEEGQITGTRVLSETEMEVSFRSQGTVLGVPMTDTGTYLSTLRPDGTLWGERGHGIVTTADGDVVTWSGQGIGRAEAGGATTWRGSVYLRTGSDKLAQANAVAGVYELEIDGDGALRVKVWEWK